ncbi:MAG: hypothetical protein ACI4B3_11830 [Prevotella sp.]
MKYIYIIIGIMLLLVSCNGRQHSAENTVAEFMAVNLNDANEMKITNFSRLDSTTKVKDSVIVVLRKNAETSGRYKKGLQYVQPSARKMLYIMRVNYKLGTTECCDTYYLDESLEKVVAVKNN